MSEKPIGLITARCADMPTPPIGSRRTECARCSAPCWVAPSSEPLVAEKGLAIVCVRCAVDDAKRKGHAGIRSQPLTEAQLAELAAHHARGSS